MKKKLLTFLLAICFMLPCAFFLTACGETPPDQPVFNGYNIFIKNEQTDTFECVYGQSAIRAGDIRIVSDWSDETKNVNHSISNFEVSVEWYDENNTKQTRFPNFWTNSSGSTNDDLATTYEFTLTSKEDNAYTLKFTVNITPILVDNCRIRIFDGDEYKYSTEMIWGHNDR